MRAKGFSLIEIIVAVGLFAVVAMLTVGSLLILTSAEKRVASVQANQDNVRFAMIEMTREIRYGSKYTVCGTSCFRVTNAAGGKIQYIKEDNRVKRSVDNNEFYPITGSDVNITQLDFHLTSGAGSFPTDTTQDRVTIVLKGVAQEGTPNETTINLQTTISMLQIDKF